MRILVCMGTRPEAIKLAPIILAARALDEIETVVFSTGQHRRATHDVLQLFGLQAQIRATVMQSGQSLAKLSARCLVAFERVVVDTSPDLVVVQGDTTSAAMGALAAFYAKIPVWHVEAGLRTATVGEPFPEELNRRLIARIASLNLAPTFDARENLLHEGISEADIEVTGNTGIDALLHVRDNCTRIRDTKIARFLRDDGPVLVVTTHRRENWGAGIRRIASAVRKIVGDFPDLRVVHAAHPNPAVRADVEAEVGGHPRVLIADPVGYGDFVQLLARSTLILTDSGGIQEEAPSLGVPVLVAREQTERTLGLAAGVTRLVGSDPKRIVGEVRALLTDPAARAAMCAVDNPYGDGHAAARVIGLIQARAVATSHADNLLGALDYHEGARP